MNIVVLRGNKFIEVSLDLKKSKQLDSININISPSKYKDSSGLLLISKYMTEQNLMY